LIVATAVDSFKLLYFLKLGSRFDRAVRDISAYCEFGCARDISMKRGERQRASWRARDWIIYWQ